MWKGKQFRGWWQTACAVANWDFSGKVRSGTVKHGNMETWKHGNMETWIHMSYRYMDAMGTVEYMRLNNQFQAFSQTE